MTEFLEKVIKKIDQGVNTVSVKSKELIEITRINSQIGALNDERRTVLAELGETVFNLVMEDKLRLNEAILAKCAIITEIDQKLQTKEEELAQVRLEAGQALGIRFCPACKDQVGEGDRFCRNCGQSLS